jgi:hypothetical protein
MIEKNIAWLLTFGATQEFLERIVVASMSIHGDSQIVDMMEYFLDNLSQLGFTVTLRAANELIALKDELSKSDKGAKITEDQVQKLNRIMRGLWPTLNAESRGMVAYIVSERRYPIEGLTEDISRLFGKGVFDGLPDIARQDFSEAGKCLAFERPTAAAFHMLRAVESVLRHYYCQKVKRGVLVCCGALSCRR